MTGQIVFGWLAYNADQRDHGEAVVSLAAYLRTGHFGEATFENFESEFLQMAFYVLLTAFLYQRGSSESKRPDTIELVDLDPRPTAMTEYIRTSQFWFESFQNWQSEFMSLAAMVVLTIFLRQRSSPESKPVDAPTWDTGA